VRRLEPKELDPLWAEQGERIFEPPYPDGRTRFTVDRTRRSFRLWFEGYGRWSVSEDGANVACESSPEVSEATRERFLFAQALPLAAALQGFELMHASAISTRTGVAAFIGVSGAGKSSIALRLLLRGRGFVTDDVLSLRPGPQAPVVHPGPPFMAVPIADEGLIGDGQGPLGRPVGVSDKVHVSPSAPGCVLPLRAVFYLETAPKLALSALAEPQALRLLASGFAPYLTTPERLARHLEITHLISTVVAQFRLQVPRTDCFDAAAEAVDARLLELGI
jgi:hypothetical protein